MRFILHHRLVLLLLVTALLLGTGCGRRISTEERELRRELRSALRERNHEKAETLARAVLVHAPADNGAWERLLQAQLGRRDHAAAKESLRQWREAVRETSPKWDEYYGNLAAALNDPRQAADSWRKVLRAQPRNRRVLEKLARLEQHERHWREAEAVWGALLALEERPHALVQRAICRRHLHRWTEAAADLHRARELAPDDPLVQRWWQRSEKLTRVLGAIRELDRQIAVSPRDAILRTERALLLLRAEEPELALEDTAAATEAAPTSMRPKLLHALALRAAGQEKEAAATGVRTTLHLDSLTPDLLETFSRLDAEIATEGANPELFVTRAWHLNEIGQPELALSDAETAARLDPRRAGAFAEQSYALSKLARGEEALRQIKAATELDPNSGTAWQYRGELELLHGNPSAAADSLSRAFAITQSPVALLRRADAYRQLGQSDKAATDQETLRRLEERPVNPR